MKLVIFAHTPPPFHGQSYMVKLLLDGLQGPAREGQPNLKVFHVDAKLSSDLEAIGKFRWSKIFLILKYCAQAYWHRFIHGANALYYVPAPGLRAAIYRDWIVMFFCRPVFRKIILHWHAGGLGDWMETTARNWEKRITHRLLDNVELSIVLSEFGRHNAAVFSPRKLEVIPNGIPDPCPNFEITILRERRPRLDARAHGLGGTFNVLFLGACTAAKGLFAALDAIALLNARMKSAQSGIRLRLVVAGEFADSSERGRFHDRLSRTDLNEAGRAAQLVIYKGFVSAAAKDSLLGESDCLVFPSRYAAEGQPITIIEALAFDLTVVATRWRGIPELLDGAEAQLVDDQDPIAIANGLEALLRAPAEGINRRVFLSRYEAKDFVSRMAEALVAV